MKSATQFMRLALRLARRGYGTTSPNPMFGVIFVFFHARNLFIL